MLVAAVVAAISAMQIYAKRGIQAGIKMSADGIGTQGDGIRYESGDRSGRVLSTGAVLTRESASTTRSNKTMRDIQTANGGRQRIIDRDETHSSGALSGRGGGVSSYSEVVVDTK